MVELGRDLQRSSDGSGDLEWILRAASGQGLSTSEDGDSTNPLCNLFQHLTTFTVKNNLFIMQKWNFLNFDFCKDCF